MKILITGGAGFIGSNLTRFLLHSGHEVTVLDNFSTGKRENLAGLSGTPGFTLTEGDILDSAALDAAMCGAEAVCHLAALGSVPRSIDDPVRSLNVNVCGLANVIMALRRNGVRRLVFSSSSSVYGDSGELCKQEDKLGKPLSPYAISKLSGEMLMRNLGEMFQLEAICLRFFNVFGPYQNPSGAYSAVIPRFCLSLLQHQTPIIYGDGSTARDFTYIDNVLHGCAAALFTGNKAAFRRSFNISGGKSISLNFMFSELRRSLAVFDPEIAGIEAAYGSERAGDIRHSLADLSAAAKELGYTPHVTAETGLALTAKWYFEHRKEFIENDKAN